ncbi:MAG: two-component regulator propeller domain-containing protein [Rikenellaceae bacterium]
MKPRNIVIILISLITTLNVAFAAGDAEHIRINKKLDITSGLAHNGVTCTHKDTRGYLWIGTYDGLNRYSTKEVITYKNSISKQIFQNNRIQAITEDRLGRLWIGTDGGVTIYDYDRHSFQQLAPPKHYASPIVKALFTASNKSNIVCVTNTYGIITYDLHGEIVHSDDLPENSFVNAAIELHDNIYILACNDGLLVYDGNSGHFSNVKDSNKSYTYTLVKSNDNSIIVSYYQGIQRLDLTDEGSAYRVTNRSVVAYKPHSISAMAIDDENTLWLGCNNNGGVLQLREYLQNWGKQPICQLQINRVSEIRLNDDRIWVSSFDDGMTQLLTGKTNFKYYDSTDIILPQLTKIDQDRVLLYNTAKMVAYNTQTHEPEMLPFTLKSPLDSQQKVVANDTKGNLWVVSVDAENKTELHRINGSKITKVTSPQLSKIMPGNQYRAIPAMALCDGDDNLWVAYLNNLYRISLNEHREVTFVESIWSNRLVKNIGELSRPRALYYEEQSNSLWVGTNRQGLFKVDLTAAKDKKLWEISLRNYKHNIGDPNSLSSDFVSSIIRTAEGTLWVGTEQGGLCRVNEGEDSVTFKCYSEDDGLSNNVIKSICEDHRGNLWIGTNIGLNCFNVKKEIFTIYRSAEGLPLESFWYPSLTLDSGELLFTGANQLVTFNPEVFYTRGSTPKINFDELKIFNTEILPNEIHDGVIIIDHRLTNGDTIKLKYNQNVFSIGINLIRDQYSLNNTLHYRIKPISEEWIAFDDNQQNISFNGVNPGRYELETCTINPQGEMSDITVLNIVITPPIWKSAHAYILYVLICLLIIYILVYTLMWFQQLTHNLQLETIEKSVHEDKLRYFSNISHELKTPLSLILAPVALLRDRFTTDVEVTSKLDIIRRQSKKLLELVNLTHGIEANDLKTLKLSPSLFSFGDMISDITTDFEFISQYDNKTLTVVSEGTEIAVEADRGMVEKILNNLLSNALKHTASGDTITLSYNINDGANINIKVADSGYGIDAKDLPHIFERFFQARRSGGHNIGGTGIGLTFSKMLVELHGGTIEVESKLSVGTTFTINLPIVVDKPLPVEVVGVESPTMNHEIIQDGCTEIFIESEFAQSTIYLAEDNQELRALLVEIIGRYFIVKEFANGAELIESLDNEWPDLIISDVMMPEMNGYELCHRVKNDVKTSHIPIILLTACTTVDDKIKGLQVGADAYIPKPFYPKHLITRIETLLHNRQQLRERFQVEIPLVYGKDSNTSAKDNEFMHQLYELFNKNLSNEEVDLDLVARELGQNRSLFFKKVKAITNTSPYELLKDYRLKKAAEMLQSREYNVNEVCMLTGFKSRSHFSRIFKERYNVAPSKYLESHSDN